MFYDFKFLVFFVFQKDLIDSSTSLLFLDKTPIQQSIDLPSISNSKMAHLLVQQQQTHRTPSINIRSSTSKHKDAKLPMTHSVDDRLFLHDSTQLLHLITRFASEPHMLQYQTTSTNMNGHCSKSSNVNHSFLQVTEPNHGEIHLEDIFHLNCDILQPVLSNTKTISFDDELSSSNNDKTDINRTPPIPLINQTEVETPQSTDDDTLIDLSSLVNTNNQETSNERHFRRRKRRASWTKTSITSDDGQQQIVDLLDKLEVTTTTTTTSTENLESKDSEETTVNKQPTTTTIDEDKSAAVSRFRGRRLRQRFYRQSASNTSTDLPPSNPPHFYLPNEALNIETTKTHSPPVSSIINLSSDLSPTCPTLTTADSNAILTTPIQIKTSFSSLSTGGLKRVGSVGGIKKNVRFADSVGRELTQVQYIRSSIIDESRELSFLLGSPLLSSSPPSFFKNNLYVPKTSGLEHKPWSFDIAVPTCKPILEMPMPRRFFCLFRQPNSEHPDIYIHEIWKSQIKLEYADIPLQVSSTGEQQLNGSLWVTNAGYSKYVSIKYTFNRWLNTYEHEAQHRYHSNDFRNIDKFEFTINIPADVDRIDFVLRYCVNGQEHWDNNDGNNYTLQTESAYRPSTTISLPHDCDFNEMRFY